MTKEKQILRRKSLAKWLKENILRLGPTFIKIGQQFSSRVDILAQEYVDQLSELQVGVPTCGPIIWAANLLYFNIAISLDNIPLILKEAEKLKC